MAMFGRDVDEVPKSLRRELVFWVLDMCRRYGEDGMGDKPAELSTTLYWLQHLSEGGPNPGLWHRLVAADEPVQPKPKRARTAKAKAKAEPKPEGASSSSGAL